MIEGRYLFIKPVNDLCQSGDILVLTIENTLCSMNIVVNVEEMKFTLVGRSQQKHLNKVIIAYLDSVNLQS